MSESLFLTEEDREVFAKEVYDMVDSISMWGDEIDATTEMVNTTELPLVDLGALAFISEFLECGLKKLSDRFAEITGYAQAQIDARP